MANTKSLTWEEFLQLIDEELEILEHWINIDNPNNQASSQEEYDSDEEYYESKLQIT